MHFRISVQIDWDVDNDDEALVHARFDELFLRLMKAFPHYDSSREGFNSVTFQTPDESVVSGIMAWLDKEKEKYQLVLVDCWTISEMVRARWLPLVTAANFADLDAKFRPFNTFPVITCKDCGQFDETVVPTPYKVSHLELRKSAEVFPARNGLFVVRERVKDLLLDLVKDQIDWGDTCLVDSSGGNIESAKKAVGVFWIRPKYCIGKDTREEPKSPCPKCRRPRECNRDRCREEKLFTHRILPANFGPNELNIACLGSWFPDREILLSGGLWAHLYNFGVKGLVIPEWPVFSAKGESPIEPERRFANLKTGKEDKVLRLKMWWQKKNPF